jgi:Dolichyl-phosphate-mannose-protein mannosyltransferase
VEILTPSVSDTLRYILSALALLWALGVIGQAINILIARLLQEAPLFTDLSIRVTFALATGWTFLSLFILILGSLDLLYPWLISLSVLSLYIPSFLLVFSRRGCRVWRPVFRNNWLELLPIFISIAAILLAAIKPPGDWDDTMYHLPYAQFLLDNHAVGTDIYLRFPFMPMHLHLVFAWLLGIGPVYFLQVVNAGFVALTVIAIYGSTRSISSSPFAGYLGVGAYLTVPFVANLIGYAYVDHALGFFVLTSLMAVAFSQEEPHRQRLWLLLSAIYLGEAIGIKFFGILAALPILAWILFTIRDSRIFIRVVLVMSFVGGYWYIRSLILTGNPFHPLASNLLGYTLWNEEDLKYLMAEQASHGVPRIWQNLPLAFSHQDVKANFLWIAFASLLGIRQMPWSLRLFAFFIATYYPLWFYLSQIQRYLMPMIPAACILSGWWIWRILSSSTPRWPHRAHRILTLCSVLVATLLASQAFTTTLTHYSLLRKEGFDSALFPINTSYSAMFAANEWRKTYGNRLVNIGLENGIYFFRGTVIGDHFGPGRYSQWRSGEVRSNGCRPLKSPELLAKGIRDFNAGMLVVRHDDLCMDFAPMDKAFDLLYRDAFASIYGLKTTESP